MLEFRLEGDRRSCLYERTCSRMKGMQVVIQSNLMGSLTLFLSALSIRGWFLKEHTSHHPVAQTCGLSFLPHFGGLSRSYKLISLLSCYIFHPSANFIGERKRLKYERNNYLQKTCHVWTKANNYKHLALSKTKKQIEGVWRSCKHCACTLWLSWRK